MRDSEHRHKSVLIDGKAYSLDIALDLLMSAVKEVRNTRFVFPWIDEAIELIKAERPEFRLVCEEPHHLWYWRRDERR